MSKRNVQTRETMEEQMDAMIVRSSSNSLTILTRRVMRLTRRMLMARRKFASACDRRKKKTTACVTCSKTCNDTTARSNMFQAQSCPTKKSQPSTKSRHNVSVRNVMQKRPSLAPSSTLNPLSSPLFSLCHWQSVSKPSTTTFVSTSMPMARSKVVLWTRSRSQEEFDACRSFPPSSASMNGLEGSPSPAASAISRELREFSLCCMMEAATASSSVSVVTTAGSPLPEASSGAWPAAPSSKVATAPPLCDTSSHIDSLCAWSFTPTGNSVDVWRGSFWADGTLMYSEAMPDLRCLTRQGDRLKKGCRPTLLLLSCSLAVLSSSSIA
mmetsp:Transcript_79868/g.180172  ORF Transcript_79868/g.180172 Transcript_79868/m.180172 type:complete len:326 (+) Transcript_79868:83-1060(+)